mgnify:CR=1 FL=1
MKRIADLEIMFFVAVDNHMPAPVFQRGCAVAVVINKNGIIAAFRDNYGIIAVFVAPGPDDAAPGKALPRKNNRRRKRSAVKIAAVYLL